MIAYHEQRNTLNSNVDEEEAKSAEVVGDVHHRPLDVMHFGLFILIGSTLEHEALGSDHALALV